MSETKNLNHQQAVAKLKHLAENKTALLTTFTGAYTVNCRPMFTQGIDDDGAIWFFSKANSEKNKELTENPAIALMYNNAGSDSYLFVQGKATIEKNQPVIDRLWSDFAKVWFEDGKDDPSLTLIKVLPVNAHYWETRHGKLIAAATILFSVITGNKADDGREGDLNL